MQFVTCTELVNLNNFSDHVFFLFGLYFVIHIAHQSCIESILALHGEIIRKLMEGIVFHSATTANFVERVVEATPGNYVIPVGVPSGNSPGVPSVDSSLGISSGVASREFI